ncbi:MAG: hypothetical protein ABR95_12040 [Sphingobacteriales bacterium BACL12 MAG-120813-bin55]|jgi:hypothetical protein|nr:MAG: hypothetical protein ABR95_12040 [Sphingobacteriales bacterium BACL12 MAG-120813-bin55]
MKKIFIPVICMLSVFQLAAQSTFEDVYALLQTNCAACHVDGHESGLSLNGSIAEVYDNIYNTDPENAASSAKGYKVVFPGDPYKSFLFSKINNGLALDVNLTAGEGAACPQDGGAPLADKDIELIRQWIIYGARETGSQVDVALINSFYTTGGIQSVPSPPAPPAPEEGFQIHYGPWFLWPEDEQEYWSKFSTLLPEDQEINRVDVQMGPYSHHFIIYKYDMPTHVLNPFGLRELDPEFMGVSLVTANQFSYDLVLPENTAFPWASNTWLDLNSHYINYSADLPLACEVFVNVYTQPSGTAVQQMYSELPVNDDIYIPNNGNEYTFDQAIYDGGNNDEIFLWGITSHTHKYGTDYDIYKRNADGSRGEHIFDASCIGTEGMPGCLDEIYDYQHPPIRYWDNFLPITLKEGLIHEASYVNNGPEPVWFGLTSDDEMMVMIYFYLEDTTGLNLPATTAIEEQVSERFRIQPNPAHQSAVVIFATPAAPSTYMLVTDMTGNRVGMQEVPVGSTTAIIERRHLPAGMYMVQLVEQGILQSNSALLFE